MKQFLRENLIPLCKQKKNKQKYIKCNAFNFLRFFSLTNNKKPKYFLQKAKKKNLSPNTTEI